jgi:hypothetical protein
MQTKLTLSIDGVIIGQAKAYARSQHRSLSNMVENNLKLVARKESPVEEISPIVASLMDVATMEVKGKGRDEIEAYLEEKHA